MSVWVEGRKVFVNTQNTQTVKICTERNIQGEYEKYYRLRPPHVLTQTQMVQRLGQFVTINELELWLREDRRATRESQNEVAPKDTAQGVFDNSDKTESTNVAPDHQLAPPNESEDVLCEILDLLTPNTYMPDSDPWLSEAKTFVEQTIDDLVREFITCPYLHRVEHSIHAMLFAMLASNPNLNQRCTLGSSLITTQLIHKEWPETKPRQDKGNRRGNFDIVVLSPKLLASCPGIDLFLEGRLPAPIVIEMGLDYDAWHLAGDAKKLINSKPKYGYLIHFVRDAPRDLQTENLILNIESATGIRTAYARIYGEQIQYKLVSGSEIIEA